tara:strand:- start:2396 stop:2962 length:567 start_codon:yes stop_codon:yes gene_type:complete
MKTKLNGNKIFKDIKDIFIKWGFSRKGLISNHRGEWYFLAQMLLIILHFTPPYPRIEYIIYPINIVFIIIGIGILIQGLIISLQALIDLGNNLTPLPYPMKESNLIMNNSYEYTRHPIYKGLLFISLGISIIYISLIHLFLFISLAYILKTKALKEEERLKTKFTEYKNYIKDVPAIMKNVKYLDWRS